MKPSIQEALNNTLLTEERIALRKRKRWLELYSYLTTVLLVLGFADVRLIKARDHDNMASIKRDITELKRAGCVQLDWSYDILDVLKYITQDPKRKLNNDDNNVSSTRYISPECREFLSEQRPHFSPFERTKTEVTRD